MKKEKTIKIGFYTTFFILIFFLPIVIFSSNKYVSIFYWIIVVFWILFFIIFCIKKFWKTKSEFYRISSQIDPLIESKKYKEAIEILSLEKKNVNIIDVNSFISNYMVLSYFALDDISSAKNILLSTEWGSFSKYVMYYKILLYLDEGQVNHAINLYAKYRKKKDPVLSSQQQICSSIINVVTTKTLTDNFYNDSIFPIVKRICIKYSSDF